MAAKLFGYAVGVVYVVFGVVGFAWTGFESWVAAETDAVVLGLQLNPTHNLAHVLVGTVLLWAATEPPPIARIGVLLVGLLYGALGIAGFFLTGQPDWNVLALNFGDNVLHLVTGVAALLVVAASQASKAGPSRSGAMRPP